MESQIEIMKGNITALKKKSEKKVKKPKPYTPPTASTSKTSAKASAKQAPKKKGGRKPATSALVDDDVLTFEQKKDLSEAISNLDGTKLEKVIQIIHEGVPEIRDVRNILYIFL
jgi:bromodomain-containing factor 1